MKTPVKIVRIGEIRPGLTATVEIVDGEHTVYWKPRPPNPDKQSAVFWQVYGYLLGVAYQDYANATGKSLVLCTETLCGLGLLEAGACDVKYVEGKAIAAFKPKKEVQS